MFVFRQRRAAMCAAALSVSLALGMVGSARLMTEPADEPARPPTDLNTMLVVDRPETGSPSPALVRGTADAATAPMTPPLP